jgi:putative cell wall-binding protein
MIKKRIKLLFIFTVLALLLLSSATVFAAQNTPTIKRLSGDNRYATSASVALNGWTQSDYAVLAYGKGFPDALGATPLAKKYNAPILLTETNFIPIETLNAIQQLKVRNIIIVGGNGVVSSAVEQKLTSLGITVTRISGQDRYETAIKVAEQLDNVTEIAITTGEGFADSLSIAPIAAKMNMPIILVQHNAIPGVVKNYINSHKLIKTYVIGSGTSLNNAVLSGLSNTELITGKDKYQINLNIIDKFKSNLNLSTIYLTTGENFADALSGSILAGKNSNPLVLVGNNPSTEKDYFTNNFTSILNINVLGGVGAVTDEIVNQLIGTSATQALPITSKVDKIEFVSTDLTKTGTNTATFRYRVLDQNGADITKTVPTSEINAVASVSSTINLDPSTETGTITFNTAYDTEKPVIVTLIDIVVGKSAILNGQTSEQVPTIIGNTSVAEIDILSTNLASTGTNTATFKYKVLDKTGRDITSTVSVSDMYGIAWIGSSSTPVTLDPLTGTGKLTYDFSISSQKATVQIMCNNGIVGTSTLSSGSTESTSAADTKVAEIHFPTYTLTKTGINTGTFKYELLNQNGDDITKLIPASEIEASVLGGPLVTLDPSTETGTLTFDASNNYEENMVTLVDKIYRVSGRIDLPPLNSGTGTVDGNSKIGKIMILSNSLAVAANLDGTPGNGYAMFKAYDQNGNDVTCSPLAYNIKFTCNVGTISSTRNGLIIVVPNRGIDLSALKSISITATDPTTEVSTSATLTIGQ